MGSRIEISDTAPNSGSESQFRMNKRVQRTKFSHAAYATMIFILCGILLLSRLALNQTFFTQVESSQSGVGNTDVLVQYSATASVDSETVFAAYCHIHGCQHIVVRGNCGRGDEVCAQMIHLALALQSHARTLFVAQDIIPTDLEYNAFDELCGDKPFSIGTTNANIRCINQAAMTPTSAVWFSSLDTVARCHTFNAKNVYEKLYKQMRQNPSDVHLIEASKFGDPKSSEWKKLSNRIDLKQQTAIGKTTRLELRYGTYEISAAVDIKWENGVAMRLSRGPEAFPKVLATNDKPPTHLITQVASYLSDDKTMILSDCQLKDETKKTTTTTMPTPFRTPRISAFEYFTTAAVQEEVRKHDRLVVHATRYMRRLKPKDRAKWKVTPEQAARQQVFVGIYVSNRDVPYINTLLMTLLDGNTPDELNSMFQIHLFNCERREEEIDFPYWRNTLAKIPLFHLHNFSANSSLTRPNQMQQLYTDTGRAMELCADSKLPWCLLLEEDAAAPKNWAKLFNQFVLQPLKGQENDISVVSLYSFYNRAKKGPRQLDVKKYATGEYWKDRAKSNAERMELGMEAYVPSYEIKEHRYPSGNVALLYSRASALRLLDYFRQIGPVAKYDVDLYTNFYDMFPKFIGKKRRQIFPAMLNHIGLYSSHFQPLPNGNFLTQLNTDARWMYDAGKYE